MQCACVGSTGQGIVKKTLLKHNRRGDKNELFSLPFIPQVPCHFSTPLSRQRNRKEVDGAGDVCGCCCCLLLLLLLQHLPPIISLLPLPPKNPPHVRGYMGWGWVIERGRKKKKRVEIETTKNQTSCNKLVTVEH